jgi:hypothetical protein
MAALRSTQLLQTLRVHTTKSRHLSTIRGNKKTFLTFVITGFSSAALTSIFLWHKKYKTTGLIPVLLAEEPESAEVRRRSYDIVNRL